MEDITIGKVPTAYLSSKEYKNSMIIDKNWMKEYIRKNGRKIIIPQNAKKIDLNWNEILQDFHEDDVEIELYFEKDSQLEEISDSAFWGCNIINKVTLPDSLKKLGNYAFYGYPVRINLSEKSELETCKNNVIYYGEEEIVLPKKLQRLDIQNATIKKITIPKDSCVKILCISRNMKEIELSDGYKIVVDENESIYQFENTEKRYNIITINSENGDIDYISFDKETKEKKFNKKIINEDKVGELAVIQYESIWDVNIEELKELKSETMVYLQRDNTIREYDCFSQNGIRKGAIYKLDEIQQIREILKEILSEINIPPQNVKDREKIIYSQIIQSLTGYMKYDYETSDIIEQEQDYVNEDNEEKVDKSQNLKGLLEKKTVCKGFSTIIQALAEYYGLKCEVIRNDTHAWNYIELDGEKYEDDFTWYQDDLNTSNIIGINTFLKGKDKNDKREFSRLEHHQIENEIILSPSISKEERFNLLTTDWKSIEDWDNINLNKKIENEDFIKEIENFVMSRKSILLQIIKKKTNSKISSIKSFIDKVVKGLNIGER